MQTKVEFSVPVARIGLSSFFTNKAFLLQGPYLLHLLKIQKETNARLRVQTAMLASAEAALIHGRQQSFLPAACRIITRYHETN